MLAFLQDPSIYNSIIFLISVGFVVFIATLVLIVLIFGASAIFSLKNRHNLMIILVFSLTLPLLINKLSKVTLIQSRAEQIIKVKYINLQKIRNNVLRVVVETSEPTISYLEHKDYLTGKTKLIFAKQENVNNLLAQLKHEFIVTEYNGSAKIFIILNGKRFEIGKNGEFYKTGP